MYQLRMRAIFPTKLNSMKINSKGVWSIIQKLALTKTSRYTAFSRHGLIPKSQPYIQGIIQHINSTPVGYVHVHVHVWEPIKPMWTALQEVVTAVCPSCTYRLHNEVEVSTGFTHRGLEARGCVHPVETEPSDVNNLYHGLVYFST